MAATSPTSAYLTAAGAVGAATVSAGYVVEGPWEPLSLTLGWVLVALVAWSVLVGRPAGLALAAAVYVVRVGLHGVAGDRSPGLALAAVVLVAMVELGSISLEARQMPLELGPALARGVVAAAGAGVIVAVVAGGGEIPSVGGAGKAIIGLAAALASAGAVLLLARDP